MTHKDEYFCWIECKMGSIRFQHHNDVIEAVDDSRFAWSIGKTLADVERYIAKAEAPKKLTKEQRDQIQSEYHARRVRMMEQYWADRKERALYWEDKTNEDVN